MDDDKGESVSRSFFTDRFKEGVDPMRKRAVSISFTMISTVLLFLISFSAYGQITFECCYGGSAREEGQSVVQCSDGGYAICGYTKSFSDPIADVYLVRTDEYGDTLWTSCFGGSGYELSYQLEQTIDGGFVIAAQSSSYGSADQMYLVKTDDSGNLQWQRTYGGGYTEKAHSVQQTTDNGYIIAGSTNSMGSGGYDMYLVKTDSLGTMEWQRAYGGSGTDRGHNAVQTFDGGYAIAGYTESWGAGAFDVYLVRVDASGDTLWTRTYGGGLEDLTHYGRCLEQTSDGGFVLTGYTKSFSNGLYDIYLIKTDPLGNLEWQKNFGGSDMDMGRSVQQLPDDGYIIGGSTKCWGSGLYDVYIVRTNADGESLWTRTFGGSGYDYGESVQRTADNGYIIGGFTKSFGSGEFDIYMIKMEPDTTGIEETNTRGINQLTVSICEPNPFSGIMEIDYNLICECNMHISVFDVHGRMIRMLVDNMENAGSHTQVWNGKDDSGNDAASGVYFLRFSTGETSVCRTVCLLR